MSAMLTLNAVGASIQYQPQNQTVIYNQSAAIGVIATGTAPLRYQWRKDGTNIVGATNDQIVFAHAQFADQARYSVIVSGGGEGSVVSGDAVLSVNWPLPGDLDCGFACGGSIDGAIGQGTVGTVLLQPNGKVLVAGGFSTVNGALRGRIARLNGDGSTDCTFMNGFSGADDWINAVTLQSDGRLVIGGSFSKVNDVGRGRVARINADGSLDISFQNGLSGANSSVYAMALQGNGSILIGGDFTKVNGSDRSSIARLNPTGALDNGFLNGLSGADGPVYSLAVQSDGKVLIGGAFTTVNGATRNRIARLNVDGSVDIGFLNGLAGADGPVTVIAIQVDGKVLLGGYFTSVNSTPRRNIARVNFDGTLDTTFLNGLSGPSDIVNALSVQSDGKIFVVGGFISVNGFSGNRVVRLNADGNWDGTFQVGTGPDNSVSSVALQPDGKVIVGGDFTTINGIVRQSIARFNANGTLDSSFQNASSGANGPGLQLIEGVNAVTPQGDGKVLIGGLFTTVNGVRRNNLARLNADGTLDSFQSGLFGPNRAVHSISVQPDGKVILGGEFSSVNGVGRNGIARLNADGTVDQVGFLNALPGANPVYATAIQSDGKVVIGGDFATVNAVGRSRIARLNTDGTLDIGFLNGLLGANGAVYSIAVQTDAKVVIGGNFTSVNGTSRNHVARLNTDGSVDTAFLNGLSGADGYVSGVALQSDGKVLVAGYFSTVNGTSRGGIARLNTDGTLDTGFQNGLRGTDGGVESVVVQSDGKVVIGGYFTAVNGTSRSRVARLNADGTLDSSFENGVSGVSVYGVNAVALQNDGSVVIGGDFTAVNGIPAGSVARLWGSEMASVVRSLSVGGGTSTLTWFAKTNHTYRVQYTTTLSPVNWIDLAGDVTAVSGVASKVDTTVGTARLRFYRVRDLP